MTDPEWRTRAACRGADPAWWFPEKHMSSTPEAVAAKATCAGCPVRADCLDYGLYEKAGIWGGEGERQRRRLRKGARPTIADAVRELAAAGARPADIARRLGKSPQQVNAVLSRDRRAS